MIKQICRLVAVILVVSGLMCAQSEADETILNEIKLGWTSAIASSQKYSSFDSLKRTHLPDGTNISVRCFMQKQGSKFVIGTSENGIVGNPTQKVSTVRVFNGNYSAMAHCADTVEKEFSNQQSWMMREFKETDSLDPGFLPSFRHFSELGLIFANSSVCLSYLFPDNEHIRVDKLTSESDAGRQIWKLEWSIVPEKVPKDLRTPTIKNGILWLDPTQSYLPIRSEIGSPGIWLTKDTDRKSVV